MRTSCHPSLSPSNKLLIPDPKPKPMSGPSTTPPTSASSSSTTATQPPDKRTRNLPNFSDCHGCGRRINYTNPRDRLLPLDSFWRIVLLCRKCRKIIRLGQACTYCFKSTKNSGDLVKCSVCELKIHGECVRDYGNSTPWCYLGVELGGFRVCVDCWVPDLLKKSIKVYGRSGNKDVQKEGKGDGKDSGGKVREIGVGKKVKLASNAREQALRKANFDSSLADKMDGSLSRTCRSKFLLNSSTEGVLEILNWNGLTYKRSGLGRGRDKGQVSASRMDDDIVKHIEQNELGSDRNRLKIKPLTYKRDKKRKIWQTGEEIMDVFESRHSQSEELKFKLHSDDAITNCSTDVSEALASVNANESGPCLDMDKHTSEDCIGADQTASCIRPNRFGQKPVMYKRKTKLHLVDGTAKCSTDVSEALVYVNVNESGPHFDIDRHISDSKALTCVDADQTTSYINVDGVGQKPVVYRRARFRHKGQVNGPLGAPGECCFCDTEWVTCKSEQWQQNDENCMPRCLINYEAKEIFPSWSCDGAQERYQHKYFKRVTTTKSYFSLLCSETVLSEDKGSAPVLSTDYSMKGGDELILPSGSSDMKLDRYCLKYAKRVKGSESGSSSETSRHSDAFQNGAYALGLNVKCNAESMHVSDLPSESFTANFTKVNG